MTEARVDWNDDQVEQLKALWADGQSCSQIARQISGASRSAVIGKVHRLGLAGRIAPNAERVRAQRSVAVTAKAPPPMPKPRPTMAENPLVLEGGGFVTLETVSDRTCRWPIGDPQARDFHFCGNAPKAGAPYCAAHCVNAYQPHQAREMRSDDGRQMNARRHPIRRGQVSMWE